MIKPALFAIGILLITVTLLSLVRSQRWWVRVFDFPRLQIAVSLALVLAGFLFVHTSHSAENVFLLVLATSLAYQIHQIIRYTPLTTPEVIRCRAHDQSSSVRLLIANVLMSNRQADRFLSLVHPHDPDLILALETDDWWDHRLVDLSGTFPFVIKQPLNNTYGIHLLSRLELIEPQVRFLVEPDVPSICTGVSLRSGKRIDLYGVHPRPPKPQSDTDGRDAEILLIAREVGASNRPAIVAGDFNDVAWSHTTRRFQRISRMLDPRVGRGMFSTFHAGNPLLRWPLDHVFHHEAFTLRQLKRLGYFGSDHFPVLVELCYEPKAASLQEAPGARVSDWQEAEEESPPSGSLSHNAGSLPRIHVLRRTHSRSK